MGDRTTLSSRQSLARGGESESGNFGQQSGRKDLGKIPQAISKRRRDSAPPADGKTYGGGGRHGDTYGCRPAALSLAASSVRDISERKDLQGAIHPCENRRSLG